MSDELRSCPFCGGEATHIIDESAELIAKTIKVLPEAAAEITRLRAELARVTALGEVLARYGRHKRNCAIYPLKAKHHPICSCGFQTAMAAWQGRGDGEG